MKQASFGQHLVKSGIITEEQHQIALDIQNKNRLLGEIAVQECYLKSEDVPCILEYMENHRGVKFGEAAISLGLLSINQLRNLLDIRTRRKIRIGDILVEKGFLKQRALGKALMSFDEKKKKLQKILVVDQSRTVRRILERMLKKYNYQVYHAGDGEGALQLLKEKNLDILIASGILKKMDGYELCRRISSDPERANVNLVILTTDTSRRNMEKAFESGVHHFLSKPVNENELINLIYRIEREASEHRKEKILVVDDSSGPRILISRELSKAGYTIYQACNGKEAVEKAKEIQPDIITMDLEMPVMSGLQASRRLKLDPATSDIPIIIVSASCTPEIIEKGFEAGAVEFFIKPFKSGKLAEYINALLETRSIQKQETILVAEDSPTTRHILKYLLNKNGYNVITATNGEEAQALLPQCRPDLILTDCYMPRKNGIESQT